ncbi:MAG: sigma-70 family RNA polymerase sigma factor [Balneolaceae bacterium]|nr:MAG: sigma-70 family RNA polymerase sigma factor [Balneolaceae bacterium]
MSRSESYEPENPKKREASDSSLEDDGYVKRAREGDQRAFRLLSRKYEKPLYYHVMKMVKIHEQIEDIVQESFVKAFSNLDSYNTDYAFSTWLYRIATNHTIDYLRKKKLQTTSIDEPVTVKDGVMHLQLAGSSETDRNIIKRERKRIITDAIQSLPEKYREVIVMRHIDEMSYQEISEELDLPLGTVKAHIFRARELLYKALIDKKDKF